MMNFLNPWALLIGGLAILGPLWAHWIQRTRPKIHPFSSFRWMPPPGTLHKRRRNLRYWPLLLLRILLVLLAALAFAKPQWLSVPTLESREKETTVWIVDRSFSLRAMDSASENSFWQETMETLQDRLASLHEETDLLIFLTPAQEGWPEDFLKPAEWSGLLDKLSPSWSGTRDGLAKMIRQAGMELGEIETEWPRAVVVFSDFQNTGLDEMESVRLDETISIECFKAGPTEVLNFSPTRMESNAAQENISSRSPLDPPVNQARYQLSPASQGVVEVRDVQPNGPESDPVIVQVNDLDGHIDLNDLAAESGIWRREIAWPSSDAIQEDNVFYDYYSAPVPVPFILIEPSLSGPVFERELFFVSKALDPYSSSLSDQGKIWSYYRTQYSDLRGWKSEVEKYKSDGASMVSLSIPDLNQAEWNLIQSDFWDFVSQGGSAWVFLGDQYDPTIYARIFSRLEGLEFGSVEQNTSTAPLETIGRNHPLWGDWESSLRRWLRRIPISRYARIDEAEDANVIARFENGIPFLISRSFGSGNIIFWNTSADREWTDWQTSGALFAPTIIRMAQWNQKKQTTSPVGENAWIVRGWIEPDPTLKLPVSSSANQRKVNVGEISGSLSPSGLWVPEDPMPVIAPGWTEALDAITGERIAWVAWNLQPFESVTEYSSAVALQKQLESQRRELSDSEKVSRAISASEQESSLWKWLLLIALLAWNFEMIIANRTQPIRHAA